jgi:hypothetical protein
VEEEKKSRCKNVSVATEADATMKKLEKKHMTIQEVFSQCGPPRGYILRIKMKL